MYEISSLQGWAADKQAPPCLKQLGALVFAQSVYQYLASPFATPTQSKRRTHKSV
jgi:hypothetical protein